MGKQAQRAEFNKFIKGLITEASPLNFPENASQEEENFELKRDGTRDRRLGIGYETGATLRTSPVSFVTNDPKDITSYVWKSVRGVESEQFVVIQTGQYLSIFDTQAAGVSGAGYKGQILLSSFPSTTRYSFSSIDGRLLVAAGTDTIGVVAYNGSTFSVEYDIIQVRDVWGVEEYLYDAEVDISYRTSLLTATHIYNLQNQSWGIPRKDSAGTLVDPSTYYYSSLGVYPSNSEAVWPGLQFQPVASGVTPYERIFPNLYTEAFGANPSAAKGYYIIDLLKRGASRTAKFAANKSKHPTLTYGTASVPSDVTSGGATVVTEYAGRVWYSGFSGQVTSGDKRSPDLSNFVVFSQLVKSRQDIVKCYEETDPTSRESPGVVDTDGGFIRISGIEKVVAMANLELGLVVLGSNGVWVITGGSEDGFKASNYKVSKISSSGCIGASTVVQESGRLHFWSEDGIRSIGRDQVGSLTVASLSEQTIQTFYEAIPAEVAANAKGMYDQYSKKVRWVYSSGESFSGAGETKELIFDTTLNAFTLHRLMTHPNVVVSGAFVAAPFQTGVTNSTVYSSTSDVLSVTDPVVINETIRVGGIQSLKYIVAINTAGQYRFTFAEPNNTDFKDWYEVDGVGVDAKAFLLTGSMTGGNSAVVKQLPYLTMHFYRTETGTAPDSTPDNPSGCLIQTRWGWSNGSASGKWSVLSQAYRYRLARYITGGADTYDTGFELISSKNKMRGRGDAFQLYMETEPGKDCRIVGWSLSVTGNTA